MFEFYNFLDKLAQIENYEFSLYIEITPEKDLLVRMSCMKDKCAPAYIHFVFSKGQVEDVKHTDMYLDILYDHVKNNIENNDEFFDKPTP